MKYCLSARQEDQYLKQADEIIFEYRDREAIFDYIDKYPEAAIILECDNIAINWAEIKAYNSKAQGNFILALSDVYVCEQAKERGIKFYHIKPVSTYYDLKALIDLGVCYVIPAAPLFFDLKNLKSHFDIGIRSYPNESNLDGLPREERICGPWIRPEDVELYDEFIDVFEFKNVGINKEKALFRIYHDEHEWPGNLDLIINGVGSCAANRMITSELAKSRLTCKQKCAGGANCKLCYTALRLADPERIQGYVDSEKEVIEKVENYEEESDA